MAKEQTSRISVERQVDQYIREHSLIPLNRRLVVAVSGGPDSVCMLLIMYKLSQELALKLHVAHLDHKLRGTESKADAAYVARLAKRLNLPCTIEEVDVQAYRAKHRLSLEEAAREVRYDFLSRVAHSSGTDVVAVGHTDDDQVETILLHLIRGTGTRGLRGLQPSGPWNSSVDTVTIIRPLLCVSRQDTVEYCREHHYKPRLDSSNLSLSLLRNKIRRQLIPLLASYNPGIKESLLRTARLAGEDLALLDKYDLRLSEIFQSKGGVVSIQKQPFLKLPVGRKRQLLRKVILEVLGTLKDIEARHIEGAIRAAEKPAGRRISLPDDLVFINEYDSYLLTKTSNLPVELPSMTGKVDLKIPGETRFSGWQVKASVIKPEAMRNTEDRLIAYLSFDKIGTNLTVRQRRPGDAFQPLGMKKTKELAEFMIDAKIPRDLRPSIPIVCAEGRIGWVVGWRIDERVKVTRVTRQILRLEFVKE